MRTGVFCVPYAEPERSPFEVTEWTLQVIRWADELGFDEAWLAEHFTVGWEPLPAPELLIAAALRETTRIRLAPGAHLLPYHHPVALAHRIAWLDHMAQGRYLLGIGAGAFPTDRALFATTAERNGAMMGEALDIMLAIWRGEPFRHEGRFWTVELPEHAAIERGPHLRPFQLPHPPMAIAGTSPGSPTLAFGGRRDLDPMSIVVDPAYLASHWQTYRDAAHEAGHAPDRRRWRLAVDCLIADSDAEALRLAEDGFLGRYAREYLLPIFARQDRLHLLAGGGPADRITPRSLAQHVWLVGSPDSVAARLRELFERTGGFGAILLMVGDYADQPEVYRRSLELFASEVLPRVRDLAPGPADA